MTTRSIAVQINTVLLTDHTQYDSQSDSEET